MSGERGSEVRPRNATESNRVAAARRAGPFVAWRDGGGALCVLALAPNEPVPVGRATTHPVTIAAKQVSRNHAELVRRVFGEPGDECVLLLDLRSKSGTEHRRVTRHKGAMVPAGRLQHVPVAPSRPLPLAPGDHDVLLAGDVWLLVGGVVRDAGRTLTRDGPAPPEPTPREHDLLVELCRPQFKRGTAVATPSNAEIAAALGVSAGYVSERLSGIYRKLGLVGTKEQNRFNLAILALSQGLVGADDYD